MTGHRGSVFPRFPGAQVPIENSAHNAWRCLAREAELPGPRYQAELGNEGILRAAGYRLAYQVFDDAVVVVVLAVGKRQRGEVYKKRALRIQNEH